MTVMERRRLFVILLYHFPRLHIHHGDMILIDIILDIIIADITLIILSIVSSWSNPYKN